MSDNILLDMLKRISDAGDYLDWKAPTDKQQWMNESTLLVACDEGEEPLLRLSDTLVTVVESGKSVGLLQHAKMKLTPAGREILLLCGK
jgi:hypothetical protein